MNPALERSAVRVETRTGDTPVSRRQRQRRYPPDVLLTTPEQLALLLSSADGPFLFRSLKRLVLDELQPAATIRTTATAAANSLIFLLRMFPLHSSVTDRFLDSADSADSADSLRPPFFVQPAVVRVSPR